MGNGMSPIGMSPVEALRSSSVDATSSWPTRNERRRRHRADDSAVALDVVHLFVDLLLDSVVHGVLAATCAQEGK